MTAFKPIALTALLASTSLVQPAIAQGVTAEALRSTYEAEGYDFIEITEGPTQIKVEAVEGDQMVEVIYDISTGDILEQEQEATEAEYIGLTGFEFNTDDDDFFGEDDDDDDDDDDDGDDGDDGDDEDDYDEDDEDEDEDDDE